MELFKDVCYLLAGLGVFFLGMHLMGDGLRKSAGKGVKALFNNLNDKKAVSFGVGMTVTAVVQASSVTTVVSIGFLNAGLMSLPTAIAISLGAKVGTTATGFLASLSSLPISAVFCVAAAVGACFIVFGKKNSLVQIGYIIAGLGTLFSGMYLMKSSIQGNETIMNAIQSVFQTINIPSLLVLVGVITTFIVQSSSTISVILIALIGINAISFETGMFILIGASVGTCFTPLIASMGASRDGKRLALMNTLCSAAAAVALGVIIDLMESFIVIDGEGLISFLFGFISDPTWKLSLFGFIYNLIAALAMLPFVGPLAALSKRIIPDKEGMIQELRTYYIDDRLFKTPQLAIMQVKKEIYHLGELAIENLNRGLSALIDGDFNDKEILEKTEDLIDYITKKISVYLVGIAGLEISHSDEIFVGSMHHVIDDIERIGDRAVVFYEQAEKMERDGYRFSSEAVEELKALRKEVFDMSGKTMHVFDKKAENDLPEISNYATTIRALKKQDSNNHIERLNRGGCDMETGTFFYSAIASLERIAEHLVNIAFSIKSITGSQTEAYASMK